MVLTCGLVFFIMFLPTTGTPVSRWWVEPKDLLGLPWRYGITGTLRGIRGTYRDRKTDRVPRQSGTLEDRETYVPVGRVVLLGVCDLTGAGLGRSPEGQTGVTGRTWWTPSCRNT